MKRTERALTTRIIDGIGRLFRRFPSQVRALGRSWQGIVIGVVVVSQLLLPLHYYVARRDPHDERFAWRMFSPMRMARCTPTVMIDGTRASLGSEFHEAWLEIAARGRFRVIEEMGARLCAKHPQRQVEVSIDCTYIDRPSQSYGGWDMCTVPQL
jgi:hypothetical protein